MTGNRPQKPQQPELEPKPYAFVSFPKERPNLKHPAGHHKYLSNCFHGTLFLTLKVQTPLHVSTGVLVMGSDIGNNRIPLIKTMVQDGEQKLSIQGSSLKGCIRSVYEAITNSTLAVIYQKKEYKDKYPIERKPCNNKEKLCPASRVFGALNWQGLLEFSDAKCENTASIGFMPSLYSPQPQPKNKETKQKYWNPAYFNSNNQVTGRKFYYNTIRAIEQGQNSGVPVQQAAKEYTFTTELHFMNLQSEELGTLLIALGQDPNYPIALKVGAGKPIGMGTMTVTVREIEQGQNLKARYSNYKVADSGRLTGQDLQQFMQKQIQSAHAGLIQKLQLKELAVVLRYPTDREPPSGMY